jgi:hypothetical protein
MIILSTVMPNQTNLTQSKEFPFNLWQDTPIPILLYLLPNLMPILNSLQPVHSFHFFYMIFLYYKNPKTHFLNLLVLYSAK